MRALWIGYMSFVSIPALLVSVYAVRMPSIPMAVEGSVMLQVMTKRLIRSGAKIPSVAFGIITSPKPQYAEKLKSLLATWARDLPQQELMIVGRAPIDGMEDRARWEAANNCSDDHLLGASCKEALLISMG
eukprot:gnl/TRDRNA2_/TRDRNA2_57543_c0_seq1.p3 gnl/TRDRNA2_/TRDRNA2_57543_c0~~gnl/TRDRNA2_/TRDRNA2_57543_c0_seq1.p3  ORF type:complete len:131 (+),score=16.07 gnl/TRDRNA2_/TRDRNA2_57543_c0_seq1:75-467(+)